MVVKYKRISSLSFTVWEHFAFQTVLKLKLWHFNMCYRWNFCLILTINIWDLRKKFTSAVFLWSWKILDVQALMNKQTKTISSFVFQDPESQTPGQSVQLGRAAAHARQTEERDGGEQSGPEQGRLQKEPGRLHPARPCKLTRASLSQTNCWMWDIGETKENSVCVDASEPESVFFESVFVLVLNRVVVSLFKSAAWRCAFL